MMVYTWVAILALGMVCAAFGTGGKEQGTTPAPQASAKVDPTAAYSPPIAITTAKSLAEDVKFEPGEDSNNNIWIRGYEQYLGIKGKVVWAVPLAQFEQKMNVAIAANDLPDIIPASLLQFKQLVDMGVATDLTQAFKDHISPLTKQIFDLDQGVALGQATIKGRLMGIPYLQGNADTPAIIWIRADWLKKLGLLAPKTMADVLKISEAFTTKDPDENGANDTFGVGLEKLLWGELLDLDGFFNGYHAYANDNDWVKDDTGKLVYGAIQPQVRPALAKLAELYESGQIDPEFAVKDSTKVVETTVNGKIGMFYGQHWNAFYPLQDSKTKDPNADWKPYPIVSVDSKPAMPITYGSTGTIYVVNKKCKNPEAAVKLLNFYLDKDLPPSPNFDQRYHSKALPEGGEIPCWEYAFVSCFHPHQNLTIYYGVRDYFNGNNTDKEKMIGWVQGQVASLEKYNAGDNANWTGYAWSGPEGAFNVIDYYWQNKLVKVSGFLGAATESMVAKNSTLNKMKLETFTKIIMGASPITDFDKFVDNWKKLGGDQITTEVNAWASSK